MNRRKAIRQDDAGHASREWSFNKWRQETVFSAAVIRHIEAIGQQTLTTDQELQKLLREYRHE